MTNVTKYDINNPKDIETYIINSRKRLKEIESEIKAIKSTIDKEEMKNIIYKIIADNNAKLEYSDDIEILFNEMYHINGELDHDIWDAIKSLEKERRIIYNGYAYSINVEAVENKKKEIDMLYKKYECKKREINPNTD